MLRASHSPRDVRNGHEKHDEHFKLQDMILLHHFTISTSLTLSKSRSFQKFYQTTVVELALKNSFLLHNILSISALHLAQTSADAEQKREYSAAAAKHHDLALITYREALQDLGEDSWSAVLMSSTFLFIYVFTYSLGSTSNAAASDDDTVEMFLSFRWVRVARGVRVIRREGQQHLSSGPLWAVLGQTITTWPVYLDPLTKKNVWDSDPPCPEENHLRSLTCMWEDQTAPISDRAAMYSKNLESLIRAYRRSHARRMQPRTRHYDDGNEQFMQSMGWMAEMTEPFVSSLEEHDPVALVLMSYYFKILDSPSFSFWWAHRNSQVCDSHMKRVLPMEWHKWLYSDQG
jgi:hypothetical protein